MPGADKTSLRATLSAARRALSTEQIADARASIRTHVLTWAATASPSVVAAYEPLRTEPGSVELLTALQATGARVLVPVTLPDRDLDWVEWSPTGAGPALGVGAVATAALVLVPASAVAADGTRLGRGGGSYDRALARVAGSAVVAALVHDAEVLAALPSDPWDRPVGWAVTPTGWHGLGRNTGAAPPG